MKFSVGLNPNDGFELVDEVIKNKEHIGEVYFSYGNFPNGRGRYKMNELTDFESLMKLESELSRISGAGVKLNVLFNAMCYGENSQSRVFFEKIGDTLDRLATAYNVNSVTTTSPLIARFVKENFSGFEVRASVNMSIGTTEGMEYISDYFDSFYLKRELNRDFEAIKKLKKWCDGNGKKLYGLANSGCLNNCSAHVFHDNLVAHEQDIAKMDNGYEFEGVCRGFLRKKGAVGFLSNTAFIRPEDVKYYEGVFDMLKLATRVSAHPARTLRAYTAASYSGNVAGLLEPDHSGVLYPYIIENSLIESCIENEKLVYGNTQNAVICLE